MLAFLAVFGVSLVVLRLDVCVCVCVVLCCSGRTRWATACTLQGRTRPSSCATLPSSSTTVTCPTSPAVIATQCPWPLTLPARPSDLSNHLFFKPGCVCVSPDSVLFFSSVVSIPLMFVCSLNQGLMNSGGQVLSVSKPFPSQLLEFSRITHLADYDVGYAVHVLLSVCTLFRWI